MDHAEHQRRVSLIEEAMRREGIDLLVAMGRGSIAQFGFLQYIAGYYPVLRFGAAILRPGAAPILAVPTSSDIRLAASLTPISDIRIASTGNDGSGASTLGRLIGAVLPKASGRKVVVGVAGLEEVLPAAELELWRRANPDVDFVSSTALVWLVKAVKTTAEIAKMENAAAIADDGFEALLDALRSPGCTMRAAAAAAEARVRERGAHEILVYVSKGPDFLHRASDDVAADGDLLTVFVELSDADGYWVELARLVSVGDIQGSRAQVAEAAVAAMQKAEAALAVGRTGGEAYLMIERELALRGFSSGLWYGHGVGVDHDLPVIGKPDRTRIEAGMVVALHPHVVAPDESAGCSICDTFAIETDRARPLSRWPRQPVIIKH